MVFSSIIFIFLFLPITLGIYYLIRPDFRNLVLLLSSLVFYFWGEGEYVYVMLFYMAFNYLLGIAIEEFREKGHSTASTTAFAFAIVVNLGVLFYFKYIVFFITNINTVSGIFNQHIGIPDTHLPIGISFFSFQAISYITDIFRSDIKSQRNPVNFSMYKAFFPQLIAGPIVRYRDVASQITNRQHSIEKFSIGLKRFIVGLAKKILIANNVGIFADAMFKTAPQELSGAYAWLGVICYALQIYYDFSGYSDMAIGLAKMFGFDFLENFNYPYMSRSIKEFWRRWHISLSSWFRDYVYVGLGGNRMGQYRTWLNLTIVFFLCGLWHGANWTFIAWGLWHGFFLVIERTKFGKRMEGMPSIISLSYTLLVVLIGWVLFRSDSLDQAYHILKAMILIQPTRHLMFPPVELSVIYAIGAGIIGAAPIIPNLIKRMQNQQNAFIGIAISTAEATWLLALFVVCVANLSISTYNPFIYFRF